VSTRDALPPDSGRLPPDFIRLLVAWFGSLCGDGLRMVALPLLAQSISPTPAAVAGVAAFTSLPWLLIAVPAGAWVDRIPAVTAVRIAHLARAVCTAGLVAVVMADLQTIWVLCLFGFLLTSAETLADAGSQTLVVRIVPGSRLEKANSRLAVVETIALDLVGPLLAGITFLIAGWLPFLLSAAAFAIAAAVMGLVPEPPLAEEPQREGPRPSLFSEIGAGLRILIRDQVLRTLVLTVAVLSLANAAQDGVLVLYVTQSLGLSESLFPTLLVAYSVGILAMAPFVDRVARRVGQGVAMVCAVATMGAAILLMGLAPHPLVGWGGYLLVGLAGVTWNVLSSTRRQRQTPVRMVARVSSAFRVIAWSAVPLGNVLGGGLGTAFSVETVFVAAGLVMIALAAVTARSFLRPLPPLTPG
jgi:MFS family permease